MELKLIASYFQTTEHKKSFGTFSRDGQDVIICAKKRQEDQKVVKIVDGDPNKKNVIIINDMTHSSGTLKECANALKQRGAVTVCAYVTHAAFTKSFWDQKIYAAPFDKIFVTDSIPGVQDLIVSKKASDFFEFLPLVPRYCETLSTLSQQRTSSLSFCGRSPSQGLKMAWWPSLPSDTPLPVWASPWLCEAGAPGTRNRESNRTLDRRNPRQQAAMRAKGECGPLPDPRAGSSRGSPERAPSESGSAGRAQMYGSCRKQS